MWPDGSVHWLLAKGQCSSMMPEPPFGWQASGSPSMCVHSTSEPHAEGARARE